MGWPTRGTEARSVTSPSGFDITIHGELCNFHFLTPKVRLNEEGVVVRHKVGLLPEPKGGNPPAILL